MFELIDLSRKKPHKIKIIQISWYDLKFFPVPPCEIYLPTPRRNSYDLDSCRGSVEVDWFWGGMGVILCHMEGISKPSSGKLLPQILFIGTRYFKSTT